MTTAADPQIVPHQPAAAPALRAADRGVADALTSVLSDHTRRVYAAQWRFFNDWCDLVGLREALKGWGRRLARPQHQAGTLTADVLSVIRFAAPRPRRRGRGFETAEQAAERARFDLALVAVLSDAGLRRFEASSLT